MAFSKIILNGTTLMDTTDKTVVAASLESGKTALGADGQTVTGTATIGGGVVLQTQTVATIATEINMRDFFAANPLPLKYTSGIVFAFFNSDNAPTQGTRTTGWIAFVYYDSTSRLFMFQSYVNNTLKPPSDVNSTPTCVGGTYFAISDGAITSNNSTNNAFYLPVGCVVKRADVPLDMNTRDFDTTEVSS